MPVNLKFVYRETFPEAMPRKDGVAELLIQVLSVDDEGVEAAFSSLQIEKAGIVDENYFTALWIYLAFPEIDAEELQFLRSASSSPCSKGRKPK